jgi:spore maturation protein CgeB
MKVLMAGDWHSDLHEEVAADALEMLGCRVVRFKWYGYFKHRGGRSSLRSLVLRAQNRFMAGPGLRRLNCDLVALARAEQPDVVFVYRGSHITPATLGALRNVCPASVILGYNNDDPFSPLYPTWMWRHFRAGLAAYDLVFAYRPHNLPELRDAGARRVALLRSWFVPARNHPVILSPAEIAAYGCDVVFIGHYEADGRLAYLEEVVRRGHRLRIFGHAKQWNPVLRRSRLLAGLVPVRPVWGEEYNKALNGARVALCFFSRLNRDGYTRRCFEIPASGTVLMSEYSDDLASIYLDGAETILFRSVAEFGQRLDAVLADDAARARIAAAGHRRAIADRHDVYSRMEDVLQHVAALKHSTLAVDGIA